MKTLIIDTATEKGVVALFQGDTPIEVVTLPEGLQSSTHLMPVLSDLLARFNLEISSFSLLIVGVGPGSYTGLRVGVTIAQAFSFACGIPLVGVSSLRGFVRSNSGPFVSVIDARSGGLYMERGVREGDQVIFEGKPSLLKPKEFSLKEGEVIVTPHKNLIKDKLPGLPIFEEPISPKGLYLEGRSLLLKGETSIKIHY